MPPPDDTAARVPLGPIGHYVIANLERLRRARGLTYRELSDKLKALGRPIPTLGLSRIEKGTRRVDVDDLVALALVLRVSPAALLLPHTGGAEDVIDLAPHVHQSMLRAWRWMDGEPLPQSGDDRVTHQEIADWVANARPQHSTLSEAVKEIVKRYSLSEEEPLQPAEPPVDKPQRPAVITAIVTSGKGVLIGRRNDGKPPWTFIAGENEPRESPADTIVREVKEETGLEIVAGDILGERVHPKTGRHMVYVAARPAGRSLKVIVGDPDELAEVRWASLAEADELLPGMFEPVREHLAQEIGE